MFLPSRRPVDVRSLARACLVPWHAWGPTALARAERSADGRRHLVVVHGAPGGVRLRLVGVRAGEAEVLAPIAARVRRAVGCDRPRSRAPLRGTSPFEDALSTLLAAAGISPSARRRVFAVGPSCPSAPRLHVTPTPAELAASSTVALARRCGSLALARRIQALARAFSALAHAPMSVRTRTPGRASPGGATARSKRCTRPA